MSIREFFMLEILKLKLKLKMKMHQISYPNCFKKYIDRIVSTSYLNRSFSKKKNSEKKEEEG
mgnify:CR=1 FL=1